MYNDLYKFEKMAINSFYPFLENEKMFYGFKDGSKSCFLGKNFGRFSEDSQLILPYAEVIFGRCDFLSILGNIYDTVRLFSKLFEYMDKSENKETLEKSIKAVVEKNKELDAAKKELGKIKNQGTIPTTEEYIKAQEDVEHKKMELQAAEAVPEYSEIAEKHLKLLRKYIENLIFSIKNYFHKVQKEYDKFLAKKLEKDNIKELEEGVELFAAVADKCITKLWYCLHESTNPSLYDLLNDSEELGNVAPERKGLIKKLFGEKFAKKCAEEMGRICSTQVENRSTLKSSAEEPHGGGLFYLWESSSKVPKNIKEPLTISKGEHNKKNKGKSGVSEKNKVDFSNKFFDKKVSLLSQECKKFDDYDYDKELELYPGLELFPEDAALVHLGKKGKETSEEARIRAQLHKVREFNGKQPSGLLAKGISDEKYLFSTFFYTDVIRYNEYLKENYLKEKNKTEVELKSANLNANLVSTTPINLIINNNSGVEFSVDLLPSNIDKASDEQLKGFKEFLFFKHKKISFTCNLDDVNSVREALRPYYDNYVAEYNEYLKDKNKTVDGLKKNVMFITRKRKESDSEEF